MKKLFGRMVGRCEINLGVVRFGYRGKKFYW